MKSSAIYTPNAYEVICRVVTIGCLTVLSTIFSYIVAVSFIGGGNRRTQRKPPTSHKSLTNFIYNIMLYRVHLAMNGVRTQNFSDDRHRMHK
jgi:hypothetical protein